ncbi:MAG: phosphohydrolase [Betaproteobacteria bacterium]|nr:phosphohydrolase [Betaproteobacteria bacterium]
MAEVLALLRTAGGRRYDGEAVSHREHALQCATLALDQGEPATLVSACLLHDIGHLLADPDAPATPTLAGVDDRHEVRGPAWLAPLFPPAVLLPIRWHVDAKRYLAATEAGYLQALSADSQRSLVLQGGPMDSAAQGRFVARPYAEEALRLRRLDEAAKQPGVPVRPLEALAGLLERCLRGG